MFGSRGERGDAPRRGWVTQGVACPRSLGWRLLLTWHWCGHARWAGPGTPGVGGLSGATAAWTWQLGSPERVPCPRRPGLVPAQVPHLCTGFMTVLAPWAPEGDRRYCSPVWSWGLGTTCPSAQLPPGPGPRRSACDVHGPLGPPSSAWGVGSCDLGDQPSGQVASL